MIDADRENQATEQGGRDVIHMQRTARHLLALHGELQKFQLAARLRQQRVGRDHRAHGGGRRAAQPRAQRNALLDLHLEAEARIQGLLHRHQGAAGRIALRLQRQLFGYPADRRNAHARLAAATHGDAIAEGAHRHAQDVESNCNIAH